MKSVNNFFRVDNSSAVHNDLGMLHLLEFNRL